MGSLLNKAGGLVKKDMKNMPEQPEAGLKKHTGAKHKIAFFAICFLRLLHKRDGKISGRPLASLISEQASFCKWIFKCPKYL